MRFSEMGHIILGIDPGLSGAIAFYDLTHHRLQQVTDMPLIPHQTNKKGPERRVLDAVALATLIDAYSRRTILAVIEDVSAMTYVDKHGETRGQGAASSFKFGKAAGIVHGICAACYIPILPVKPAIWKSLMGLSRDKDLSRSHASKLFPDHAQNWQRKKDDGRAEAALLAYFGAMRLVAKG